MWNKRGFQESVHVDKGAGYRRQCTGRAQGRIQGSVPRRIHGKGTGRTQGKGIGEITG